MIALGVALLENDATLRAAVEQSVVSERSSVGDANESFLTGGRIRVSARTLATSSTYSGFATGAYGQMLASGSTPQVAVQTRSISAGLGGEGQWQLSPRVMATSTMQGLVATRLGLRSDDALIARDPFAANRLEYALDHHGLVARVLSDQSTAGIGLGYSQSGALSAEAVDAVGVDAHTARGRTWVRHAISEDDQVTPEVEYAYTYFYHALLDARLDRGVLDVHVTSTRVSETHAFSRRTRATASAGASYALSTTSGGTTRALVPEASALLAHVGSHYRLSARYAYAFTSLGPRIGYGRANSAGIELAFRPMGGSRWRDLQIRALGRFVAGTTPTVAGEGQGRAQDVTTYSALAGARIDVPILRAIALTGGVDIEYTSASVVVIPDRSPEILRTIGTLGLSATWSTDPRETVLRDPEQERERRTIGRDGATVDEDGTIDVRRTREDERSEGGASKSALPDSDRSHAGDR